jgi:hypothetical protein
MTTRKSSSSVIPGPSAARSPESILPVDCAWHGSPDPARAGVMDSGLALRAPRNDGTEIRSRDAFFCARALPRTARMHCLPNKKGRGGAPTGAPTVVRATQTNVAVCLRFRARKRAHRSALASRRSTAVLATGLAPNGSAPGQASWDAGPAGVTHLRLSQSRESTSHTGRSTGGHDTQSRPGTAVNRRSCIKILIQRYNYRKARRYSILGYIWVA